MRAVSVTVGLAILALVLGVVLRFGGGGVKPDLDVNESGKNPEGEYVENPFSEARGASAPKMEAGETVHDFGVMSFPLIDGDDADDKPDGGSHTFVIKNTGAGVLKLAKGPSTCQCTMSDMQGDIVEVPPGGSTEITITWVPEIPADPFEKGASIWTNDPAMFAKDSEYRDGKLMLNIKGRVLKAVDVEPGLISLGTISERGPTPLEGIIFSRVDDDMDVILKSSNSEHLTVELQRATMEELQPHQGRSGWKFKGSLEPKLPIGRFNGALVFGTDDLHVPEINVTVEAQRKGPVSIAGRYWDDAYSMVDFERFKAAKGIETTLSLYAAKHETPTELKVVEVQPSELIVTTERDSAYADTERERFLIKVQVPAGRAPERLMSKEAGFIQIETNLPDVPALKFHVVYESE